MTPCRIAMICFHSCPQGQLGARDVGGMNVYVRELARGLGALGYEVDIFTRAHNPPDLPVVNLFQNVRLIHLRAGPVEDMDKMAQFSFLAEFRQGIADFALTEGVRYCLIHSHYWLSGLAGLPLSDAWGVPLVTAFHTLGAAKNSLPVGKREPDVRLAAEREVARACRHLIATTKDEEGQLMRLFGVEAGKISVVPCGIDIGLFRPVAQAAARQTLGLAAGVKIALFVGRIEPLKGLGRLVRALSLLPHDLRLLIIGGDACGRAEVEGLISHAEGLGVAERIEFLGAVSQERLPLYYSAADATVVASYYESFCLVILESLACGTPVVSTKVGIAPAVLGGINGCVADEGTPQALAHSLAQVLDLGRDSEVVRHRQGTVAAYNWTEVAERVAAAYERVLMAGGRAQSG